MFGLTLLANTAIALLLTALIDKPLAWCFAYSYAIGLSIFSWSYCLHCAWRGPRARWVADVLGIGLGGLTGVVVARYVAGRWLAPAPVPASAAELRGPLVSAIVFGAAVSYWLHQRAALAEAKVRLQEEALRRAEDARRLTEAELKLLQAQIEPHFLFNALSNVIQLVDAEPAGAKRMLQNLTSYLRASLRRTRAGATSLGEELDVLRAYLEIQSVRMGARLRWRLDCPPELRHLPLAPLLLQPLVENAVRHGLGPKPTPGRVTIRAEDAGAECRISVEDDGVGMDPEEVRVQLAGEGEGDSLGLGNVDERLRAVFGDEYGLVVETAPGAGTKVSVRVPKYRNGVRA
jgi:two-component system LytT family sensor kinase